MDPKILALFDDYLHKALDRREFLSKLVLLAGGTAAAFALLPLLERNHAGAAIVPVEEGR